MGVQTKQVNLGTHVMDGQMLPLPNAILRKIGDDNFTRTRMIYGQFDVQPASLSDGWASSPCFPTADSWVEGVATTRARCPAYGASVASGDADAAAC